MLLVPVMFVEIVSLMKRTEPSSITALTPPLWFDEAETIAQQSSLAPFEQLGPFGGRIVTKPPLTGRPSPNQCPRQLLLEPCDISPGFVVLRALL